jgi:hypothetical protein
VIDQSELVQFRNAVRGLVDDARRRTGVLRVGSPERRFLLGVDAAAVEVLHPELADTRRAHWLDAETPEFRDGYRRTRLRLAGVRRAFRAPLTITAPVPRREHAAA